MTTSHSETSTRAPVGLLGVLAIAGFALTTFSLRRGRAPGEPRYQSRGHAGFAAYLREHLSGADAAIRVVGHLGDVYRGTLQGNLFRSLHDEFQGERLVVTELLASCGASALSAKRLAGRATGNVLKLVAGGEPGDPALFRTLEALAIGVQGKRCMWRALQMVSPPLQAPGPFDFAELEAQAVRQWEAIEQHRLSIVASTFDF